MLPPPLIHQMASIRSAEAELRERKRLQHESREGGGGGGQLRSLAPFTAAASADVSLQLKLLLLLQDKFAFFGPQLSKDVFFKNKNTILTVIFSILLSPWLAG